MAWLRRLTGGTGGDAHPSEEAQPTIDAARERAREARRTASERARAERGARKAAEAEAKRQTRAEARRRAKERAATFEAEYAPDGLTPSSLVSDP